jgi:L-threonylcarbamoyladenylate synthase
MPPVPNAAEIEAAARLLRAGRLVAFPTETVYGLGANALDPEAVARIYAVKGRPPTSPLIVRGIHQMAQSLVTRWPEVASQLARRFWPGPLTLVLEKQPTIPSMLRPAWLRRLADACTSVALDLIRAPGAAARAPSASRFTQLSQPSTTYELVWVRTSIILDGGPCESASIDHLAGGPAALLLARAESRGPRSKPSWKSIATATEVVGAHPSPGMHRATTARGLDCC